MVEALKKEEESSRLRDRRLRPHTHISRPLSGSAQTAINTGPGFMPEAGVLLHGS